MKSMISRLIISTLLVICMAAPAAAEAIYVTGVTQITMRTGPGTGHKILAMLTSGTKLEIVEYQKDWSMVKNAEGKQGWVLSRFLTRDIPKALVVKRLEKENQGLKEELYASVTQVKELTEKNEVLMDIEKKYHQLKQASADYLKLDAAHKELAEKSRAQDAEISRLKENLNNEEKLWFLSGAGVFIVGLIIGLSSRKKKRHSLLS